jgi:CheY-like chemotaxis protein
MLQAEYQIRKPFPGIRYPVNFTSSTSSEFSKKSMPHVAPNMMVHQKELYVLLADDDSDDRDFFVEAVEESGLPVKIETAEDGEALLKLLKNSGKLPDIIFLDLNMPNKNGRECLGEIRKTQEYLNIPVVIYSTSSSSNDIDDTFKKGANLYVSKPSSFNELKTLAKTVLNLDWNVYKPNSNRKNFVYSNKTL